MDQCAAHNSEGLTLKHVRLLYLPASTTSYMQPLDQGIIYCMKRMYRRRLVRFLLREIDRDVPAEGNGTSWMLCEVSPLYGNPSCLQQFKTAFAKCGFGSVSSNNTDSDEENFEWVELQGHNDCPSTFEEFLNVDKSVPTTTDQPTRLDGLALARSMW
jgi:hypothetical protein